VTEEVGQEDQDFGARGQLQRLFLMGRVAATDVVRDRDVVSFEQVRNVSEPVCSDDDSAERHDASDD